MKGYTPINKGNYSDIETDERKEQFEEKRGFGWEDAYQEYRKNWSDYPKQHHVPEYPLLVDIELSTICNLKCPMCYTLTEEFQSSVCKQFMERELFCKIIDEIAGKVPAVRLSLRGESTLHPEFVSFIHYCKEKGIPEISFLTNGSKLARDYFIEIAQAGADWITISIDGTGEMYESIRKPLKFEDTLEKLRQIHQVKQELGLIRPVIKIQSIWPAIRENPEEYYNIFAPYVDLIAFNPLIDYLNNDEDILYEDNFICPQLYQRLIISSDGTALSCSNDENGTTIVGDANIETIYEIWHGEKRAAIRRCHEEGRFKDLEVCRKCYIPRKTEENEFAVVNGRRFAIKNYVNRVQTIGK